LARCHPLGRALAPVVEKRSSNVYIANVKAGVAHNANRTVDLVESFSGYLKDRRTEIACDSIISDGAIEPAVEETPRQPLQP
jgi:hypothetical protein